MIVTDEMVSAAHEAFRTSPPDQDGFPDYDRAMRAAIEAALAAKPAGVPREAIAMVQDCIAARDYDEAAERLRAMYDAAPQSTARDDVIDAKLFDDWHEDIGPVLWVSFPIEEAPWCGTPLYSDWPSYHTHWIPLPDCNRIRALTSNDGA